MAESPTITWEALNAYVDNELAPEAAAEVAAAIARDPALAARVATLSRLRATMRSMPPEMAAPAFGLPARRPATPTRFAALAATFVLVAALSAATWHLLTTAPDVAPLSAAIAAHRAWLADAKTDQGGRLQVEMAGVSASALPDLTLASLKLVRLSLDPAIRQGGGALAGYVGPNGCKISLWIAPDHGPARPQPVAQDREGLQIRSWSVNQTDYALLGRGIDSLRLDRIAALVARLTQPDRIVSQDQIAALDEARSVGAACTG